MEDHARRALEGMRQRIFSTTVRVCEDANDPKGYEVRLMVRTGHGRVLLTGIRHRTLDVALDEAFERLASELDRSGLQTPTDDEPGEVSFVRVVRACPSRRPPAVER